MDLAYLLQPLDAQLPCGVDMSFSAEFDRIQEARRFDDPHLSQGEWVAELKEADWPAVVSACSALLATRTKDLRVAVWLLEGWAKTRGFAGLAQGYTLLARLCERYWDSIHPLTDEGDPALRAGCLSWLLAQSGRIIRELPLTDPTHGGYSSIDLEAARALSRAIERTPAPAETSPDDVRPSLALFEAARVQTPAGYYRDSLAAVAAATAALESLQVIVADRLGADGPGFSAAFSALDGAGAILQRFAADAGVEVATVPGSAPHTNANTSSMGMDGAGPPAQSGADHGLGAIHSRAQALDQLRRVADYFRRAEPHSPVAYLADKAAHWGEMPLHEWLRAVLGDDAALARVEDLLGVGLSRPS